MMSYLKAVLLVALLLLPNAGVCQDSPVKADEQMNREASELDAWSNEQFGNDSMQTPVRKDSPSGFQPDAGATELPVMSTPAPEPRREDTIMQTTPHSSSSPDQQYISDEVVRGAETGAGAGAIGGAVGGNARKGAKIGAATGAAINGIREYREEQEQDQ